jgi:hypothetical protein
MIMGKGRFVNQKLGKNVGRKVDLLKSALSGRGYGKTLSRPDYPLPSRKDLVRGKP